MCSVDTLLKKRGFHEVTAVLLVKSKLLATCIPSQVLQSCIDSSCRWACVVLHGAGL
jgi:hypothetical protein